MTCDADQLATEYTIDGNLTMHTTYSILKYHQNQWQVDKLKGSDVKY
jgi:hypothetical protein